MILSTLESFLVFLWVNNLEFSFGLSFILSKVYKVCLLIIIEIYLIFIGNVM